VERSGAAPAPGSPTKEVAAVRVAHRSELVTVIDDLLPPERFASLAASLQILEYAPVHERGWVKGYDPHGLVLRSELVMRGERDKTPTAMAHVGALMDELASADSPLRQHFPARVGAAHQTVTGRVVLFGRGAGLSWHRDGDHLAGAFVYYGHPDWSSNWGGELMVMAAPSRDGDPAPGVPAAQRPGRDDAVRYVTVGPEFGVSRAEAARRDVGMGTFISAKPNRMVILAPTTEHSVAPVTAAAGDRFRCAIAGFFLDEDMSVRR
jgi:hypothetical protein